MKAILQQLARTTLLPAELSAQILAGTEPRLEEMALSLVIGALDCQAMTYSDPAATMTEKRLARGVTIAGFLAALLADGSR